MLFQLSEQIVNGLVTGSVYAIVAVGMTMIFGVLRAINFAQGEYYMLGTFGAWVAVEYFVLPYPVSVAVGVVATALVAMVVDQLVMRRMVGMPAEAGVLATLGLALILQNTVILVFGGGYKFFDGGYIEPVTIFGISLAEQRVLIVVVCLLVFVGTPRFTFEIFELYNGIDFVAVSGGFVTTGPPLAKPENSIPVSEGEDETYLQVAQDRLNGLLPERVTENELMRRYELTRGQVAKLLWRVSGEGWIERLQATAGRSYRC